MDLAAIRKKYRFSQGEFGKAIGISSARMSRYEHGWDKPCQETSAKMIAQFEKIGATEKELNAIREFLDNSIRRARY